MCGIAGLYSLTNNRLRNGPQVIEKMLLRMKHRGPNDDGIVDYKMCVLGQTRLSIIDTTSKGRQPFTSQGKDVSVSVNGEIYNYIELRQKLEMAGHVFTSRSDSEVVLHGYREWGDNLAKHLRGMFAYSVYDHNKKELTLCRDRQGIKPLYYTIHKDVVIFASEISSILESGLVDKVININGVRQYLHFGYIPQTGSIIKNVFAVNQGSHIKFQSGRSHVKQYWMHPEQMQNTSVSEVVHQTRTLLDNSIKRHLQSDVPLGIFLSGGIDSTAVLGLSSQFAADTLNTFSIGFDDGPGRLNELKMSRKIANHYSTNHNEFILNGSYVEENIGNIIEHMDMPTFDGINTYVVSKKVKEAGITVALSGLGGDELFGGYGLYKYYPQFEKLIKLWSQMPLVVKTNISKFILSIIWSKVYKSKIRNIGKISTPLDFYLMVRANGDSTYLSDRHKFCDDMCFDGVFPDEKNLDCAWKRLQHYEMNNYMSWRLLRDTDVMSMANSLEVRVPLLDDDLVEFVLSLPCGFEKRQGWPKKLLVNALHDVIPDFVKGAPKQGFQLPMNVWMNNELKYLVVDSFSSSAIKSMGLFNENKLTNLYRMYNEGHVPYEVIWKFVALDLWIKKNNLSVE